MPIIKVLCSFLLARLGKNLIRNASGTISTRLRARNTSLAGAGIVAKYFTAFPLMSSKMSDLKNWREVYAIIIMRQAKSESGFTEAKKLKESINSRRTIFTWDHLSKFYTR